MKTCNKCGNKKETWDFHLDPRRKDKRCSICINCVNNRRKELYSLKSTRQQNIISLVTQGLKHCSECGENKPLSYFGAHKRNKDGLRCSCKLCGRKSTTKWLLENPGYKNENSNENSKRWALSNPDKVKKKYQRRRLSPKVKLSERISSRMRGSLRGTKSSRHWEDIVGYNVNQLKAHLVSLFTEGMTVELLVTGKIHIDHKIPISAFHYESLNDDNFKLCWSLENLQPMWATENHKKGARLFYEIQTDKDGRKSITKKKPI